MISTNGRHKFSLEKKGDIYDLDISDHPGLKDIYVLTKLPLKKLNLSHTSVRNLSPLKEMSLDALIINNTFVSELGALKKMALIELDLRASHVTKINEVNFSRLKRFYMNDFILNLQPLSKARVLEEVYLPKSFKNHKQLSFIPENTKLIFY